MFCLTSMFVKITENLSRYDKDNFIKIFLDKGKSIFITIKLSDKLNLNLEKMSLLNRLGILYFMDTKKKKTNV